MNQNQLICGVDEAGRGPLAGAVYAAAVILNPEKSIMGLADSKKLSEKRRDALALEIKEHAFAWAIAYSTVEEIDELNILQASLLAMKRAIESVQASLVEIAPLNLLVQVDGNQRPKISLPCEAIVKGDSKVQAISAASILAKTARDAALYDLDRQYPMYGFAQHKGYPTAAHIALLRQHGVSPVHRRSYAPVKALI
ncbi:ribonuclease HII [Methylotenera sp.]|jgi:ribonuclease HII|uniref:ribonuclease HII n=1 Tax=Methylotenera sp. TaxID=2051956 RepID=UPI000D401A20|nr:ribonuclease HII [Methylotenera sp.]MDP3211638.1 ribonuclease HII [Methylotenera sp.]PPD44119.1 MAG: ribonuclease HII [Methylotenera sp.]